MRVIILVIALSFLTISARSETYKWEDGEGMHFTDDLSKVPQKKRARVLAESKSEPNNAPTSNETKPKFKSCTENSVAAKLNALRAPGDLAVWRDAEYKTRSGCNLGYSFKPIAQQYWNQRVGAPSGDKQFNENSVNTCVQLCTDEANRKRLDTPRNYNLFAECCLNGELVWEK